MKVLLTGGAGYIGSHTAKWLSRRGFSPVVYDDLSRGHAEAVKWGPLERGALADRKRLAEVLERHRPVAVVHFAALAYVGESVAEPARYYENNVAGSLSLLEAMRGAGVGRIVFSSTCATYGIPERLPIREEDRQDPINPYGRSKLMVEKMLEDYGAAYGIRSIALRYFNAAGADPDGEIGEHHDPETHLIPLVLDAALGIRPHISVFGNDYPTPDGTCIRDYIHVADLSQAHAKALEHLLNGGESLRLNLGNGNGYSVAEIIRAAERVTGRPIKAVYAPRRPGDPASLVGSAERARSILGWEPAYADLDTILSTAWAWHRKLKGADAA